MFNGLHPLTRALEPSLWQLDQFGWQIPKSLQGLQKYTAGAISIGTKAIEWSVLSKLSIEGTSWQTYVGEDVAEVIIATLIQLNREVGIGSLEEISICLEQPINPENEELANGVHPSTTIIEQGEVVEIPSGSILLFPNALKLTPYRNVLPDIPHIVGIVAHEWAHQFMSTENTRFFQEWLVAISGWEQEGECWVYRGTEPLPTLYAGTNPVDDFIESLVLYLLKRMYLHSQNRLLFCQQFVEKLRRQQ